MTKFKILLLTAAAIGSVFMSSSAFADQYDDAVKSYTEAGQRIIDMVNSGNVDVAAVEKDVIVTLQAGVDLAHAYAAKHPEGKAVLDKTIETAAVVGADGKVNGIGPMGGMPFSEIEADWHDVGYFTKNNMGVDLTSEDNEHYTDPMHVIIHPVMTYAAAKDFKNGGGDESLKAMKAEMQEGIEQVNNTANAVK
jgi:hypothetical protein